MNKTVLVVDDDDALRESLCESLGDEGYSVLPFANGKEALDWLLAHTSTPPCMIFLDLMMPVMNGWQFREAQKRDLRIADIPVVVITAGAIERDALDVQEIMAKPIELDALLDRAEHYCPC